jgi:hypothetical protein
VGLEWQLNHIQPVLGEDCVSVLANVAERADEVIPVQQGSRVVAACAHIRSSCNIDSP